MAQNLAVASQPWPLHLRVSGWWVEVFVNVQIAGIKAPGSPAIWPQALVFSMDLLREQVAGCSPSNTLFQQSLPFT